ncbi:MAG: cobalamin biosynthesis protein CbiA [Desulfobacteraceae bacterium 4572_88]|nr:MAG: cobalamin biosynthesis protein CbiA [Desulfobacteraceae bacterium 4572_88]
MEIGLSGIVIIVGAYGSGKTEVAVNLAVNRKRAGMEVRIADVDLVNPYFRTREARKPLSELGIEVVLPPEMYMQADLPILSPAIAGMIRQPAQMTILDAGGDDAGVTVLASLADHLEGKEIQMFQVVNPFRPFTDTVQGCMKICGEIEKASKMAVTGIVGNANMIEETNASHIYEGYDFVKNLSEENGLPLKFVTVTAELLPETDMKRFSCPVLPIERQLVPPWKKAVKFGSCE